MNTHCPLRLNVALCDDNAAFLTLLHGQLEDILAGQPHQIHSYSTPEALLGAAQAEAFSLAVMDIRMPGQDGIRLAEALLALCPCCQIVFLTGYLTYAQDVYDVPHVAFILKEEMAARLPPVIERLCRRLAQQDSARLVISAPGAAQLVPQQEIFFLERAAHMTRIHCRQGVAYTAEKLESLLKRLDPLFFVQSHKSYAINWAHCRHYVKKQLHMDDGTVVPISRHYAARVRSSFLQYTAALRGEEAADDAAYT